MHPQEKAETFYKGFVERWDKEVPSAVKSLSQSIDSCLAFFSFPEERMDLPTDNECH
jgi:putative transposase